MTSERERARLLESGTTNSAREGVDPPALQMLEWIEHRLALHGVQGRPEAVREGVNGWRIVEPYALPEWRGILMTAEDLAMELRASAWLVEFQEECFRHMRRSGKHAAIPTPPYSLDMKKEQALHATEVAAGELLRQYPSWRQFRAYWGYRAAGAATLTLFVESRDRRETVFVDVPADEVWAFGSSDEADGRFRSRVQKRLSMLE